MGCIKITSPRAALGVATFQFKFKHGDYYTLALVMANCQLGGLSLLDPSRLFHHGDIFADFLMGDRFAEE
jgi:hypothetical protein